MRITSKGQVTIPKEIRDEFGLLPGTEIEFFEDGGEIRIRKVPGGNNRGREIVEHLRQASGGKYRLSTEEIMRMTRGEDWGTGRLEEGDGDPS
ncbi:MAG TPA: AbrB/MazE/SpoVT family DNA-binding domain-containing protein [Solirubrobacterales bacterium]|nr:AbrB/MazE/SpoVT family DNA-binding domain-containing protein [Solirubrobacterales bacterium]